MKTRTYKWGNRQWTFYNPKINRKRQSLLGSLILGDLILPMTFGAGIFISKAILKINPMFLYK